MPLIPALRGRDTSGLQTCTADFSGAMVKTNLAVVSTELIA